MPVLDKAHQYQWSEYATPAGDKAYAVYGVPIFAPAGEGDREDLEGLDFGKNWMASAVQRYQERARSDYWSPAHLEHQDPDNPTGNKPFAGFLDNVHEGDWMLEGKSQPVIITDIVDIPPSIFSEIRSGKWPYASIEIRPPYEEISSLALLSTIPPHHKFGVIALESNSKAATFCMSGAIKLNAVPRNVNVMQFSEARAAFAAESVGGHVSTEGHLRPGIGKRKKEDKLMQDEEKKTKDGEPPFPFQGEEPDDEKIAMMEGGDKEEEKEMYQDEDEEKRPPVDGEGEVVGEEEVVVEGQEEVPEAIEEDPPEMMQEGGEVEVDAAPPAAVDTGASATELAMTGIMAMLQQIMQAVGVGAVTQQETPDNQGGAAPMPDTVEPVATLQTYGGIDMDVKKFSALEKEVAELKEEGRQAKLEADWKDSIGRGLIQLSQEGRPVDVETQTDRIMRFARESKTPNETVARLLKELKETTPPAQAMHRAYSFAQSSGPGALGTMLPPALKAVQDIKGCTPKVMQFAQGTYENYLALNKKNPNVKDATSEIMKGLRVRGLIEETESGIAITDKGRE
jgi:hypothetical protein